MKKHVFLFIILACLSFVGYSQVGFNANPINGCAPLAVTFTNTTNVPNANYFVWNYNDGSPTVHTNTTTPVVTHTFSMTGNFNVNLSAFDTTAGMMPKGNFSMMINVMGSNLQTSEDTACPNQGISMSIWPNGNNYNWNFGDGNTSNQMQPVHSYTATGTYTVTLSANTSCGNQNFTHVIHIMNGALPNAQFNNTNMVCPNDVVQYWPQDGNASSYSWTFGDGGTSTQSFPVHSYTTTGNYVTTLTITSTCGTSRVWHDTVKVKNNIHFPNSVQINTSTSQACPGDPITFNYNYWAISQTWKFGNGDSSIVTSPVYSYSVAGTYTVTLKLHNGCNLDTTISKIITIGNFPYTGGTNMQFYPNPACPNDLINFQCSQAASYQWSFGDGNTSTLANPTHSYSVTGTYTVSLKLYNGCGNFTTVTQPITISNTVTPTLMHTYGGNGNGNWGSPGFSGCPGDTMIIYVQSGFASYNFAFGDGFSTTNASTLIINNGNGGQQVIKIAKHAFSSIGVYTATLTVTNGCGNSATDTLHFNINNGSPVNGGMQPSGPFQTCKPVHFLSIGGASYQWNFGDASPTFTTTATTTTHAYTSAGTYSVSVLITNGCGNTATYSKTITVQGITASETPSSVTCFGGSNGNTTITASNGVMPYAFSMDGSTFQAGATFNGLSAGTHTVTVMDSTGCTISQILNVNQPAQIVITPSFTNATCGNADGAASVMVTGGIGAYSYSWTPVGGTGSSHANLLAGPYVVYVTDANNCTANVSITINDIAGPTVTYTTPYSPVCVNSNTIALSGATPSGGIYSGVGVNGSVFDPSSAGPGTHSIVYSYTSGNCTSSATATITVHALPMVSITSNPNMSTVCSGTTVVLSGHGASTYTWSPPANLSATTGSNVTATTTTVSPISYTVTGTDANGCTNMSTVTFTVINCSTGINQSIANVQPGIHFYPNPTDGRITLEISDAADARIELYNGMGQLVYSEKLNENCRKDCKQLFDLTGSAKGIYLLRVYNGGSVTMKQLLIQ